MQPAAMKDANTVRFMVFLLGAFRYAAKSSATAKRRRIRILAYRDSGTLWPAPIDSQEESIMFTMAIPWWELIVRSLIVYAFLLVILRITGKRQVGQLA